MRHAKARPEVPVVVQNAAPAAPAGAAPRARGPRPNPAAAPLPPAQPQYSGSLAQLTPMVTSAEEGPEGVISVSPNQGFNAGGEPVFTALDEEPAPSPTIPRYEVLEAKNVALNGHRFTLQAGKIVDASNYNIALLKRCGVKLKELTA